MPHQPVKIGSLTATLHKISLPIGLEIEQVDIEGEGLQLSTEPLNFKLPKPGKLKVRVTEKALAAFLNKKSPGGLKDFKVKITGGFVNVEATATLLIPLKALAKCGLSIKGEGKHLWVDLVSVDVAGIGAKSLVQNQIDQVNPVFDMDQFPITGKLDTVQIGEGEVHLSGSVAP